MVCLVRKVILRPVLLKMFVIYVVSLLMYVKLAHFWVVWVVVGLLGRGFVWFYREGVIVEDVMYCVQFLLVFFVL